MNDMTGKS